MLGASGSQFRGKQAGFGFLEFNRQFLKWQKVQEGSEDKDCQKAQLGKYRGLIHCK